MTQLLESSFSIRNLLRKPDGTNPALTPPPSDGSISPNNSISCSEEDHGSRPNFTYSALVAMAIRNSPEGKLTLNAIQKWISDNFPYYRKDEHGWQNKIRQTLSTNSCFQKIRRAMNDPGRGNYWSISSEVGIFRAQQPAASNSQAVTNGIPHPQTRNAVYFPMLQKVQGPHQTMLVQSMQEQYSWYQYHLQQSQLLQQQLAILQRHQIQQQHQEVYHKLAFHQQQIAFLTAKQSPA